MIPTPLVESLGNDVILPVEPILVWNPNLDYPWFLFNSSIGLMYYDPESGIHNWPPNELLDPVFGTPRPIELPKAWSLLAPTPATYLQTHLSLAQLSYNNYIGNMEFQAGPVDDYVDDYIMGGTIDHPLASCPTTPENPGHEDLFIESVFLMHDPGVNLDEQRVDNNTQFTLSALVKIVPTHLDAGTAPIDRDYINVRLSGRCEVLPIDDEGLLTSITHINGYRLLGIPATMTTEVFRGTAEGEEDDADSYYTIDNMETMLGWSVNYHDSGEYLSTMIFAGTALEDGPESMSKTFEFTIDSSLLYSGIWNFTVEVDYDNYIMEYCESNNIFPPGGNSLNIIIGDAPIIEEFKIHGALNESRSYSICEGSSLYLDYKNLYSFDDPGAKASIHYYLRTVEVADYRGGLDDVEYFRRFREDPLWHPGIPPGTEEYHPPQELENPLEGTGIQTIPIDRTIVLVLRVEGTRGAAERYMDIFVHSSSDSECGAIDFNGIPFATNILEAQERLDARRWAAIRYHAERDFTHLVEGGDRDGPCLLTVAKLWRAYFDPDPSFSLSERSALVEEVNTYLNDESVQPTRIGTYEPMLELIGFDGQDYDFRLRILTALMHKFEDVSNPSLGDALWPETKAKLMDTLLSLSGNQHHTLMITEDVLENNIKNFVVGLVTTTFIAGDSDDVDNLNTVLSEYPWVSAIIPVSYFFTPFTRLFLTRIGVGIAAERIVKGDVQETENHILMSETSRYLKNQLIASGRYADLFPEWGDSLYNNASNGFNEWIIKHLFQFIARGFNEYNSNRYSNYSTAALLNLYDYATDPDVKLSARIILDYISAHFALQSYDLKRCVGLCRLPEHLDEKYLWEDPMAAYYAVLIGNYAGLMDNFYYGRWPWKTDALGYASFTTYRVPDVILDLAIDKSKNPYEVHVNHAPWGSLVDNPHAPNIEILSAQRGYLLSAGGRVSFHDNWWRRFLEAEYDGWARPTTLIVRNRQMILENHNDGIHHQNSDYLIYAINEDDLHTHVNNTGVYRNMAVSAYDFHIPSNYNSIVQRRGPWRFLHLAEQGLYIGINNAANLLEVVDDEAHGGGSLADFMDHLTGEDIDDSSTGSYRRYENPSDEVYFDTHAVLDMWPIVNKDGDMDGDVDDQDRIFHTWPFIESVSGDGLNRVMWADGEGKMIVNNPAMGSSLILSLIDWRNPIRLEQGCVAEDLTDNLYSSAFSSADDAGHTYLAFDGKRDTAWHPEIEDADGCPLEVHFYGVKSFNFISIRTAPGYEGRISHVRIEKRADREDDFNLIGVWEVPHDRRGIDIQLGPQMADAIRFIFIPRSSPASVEISEIEVYRYAGLFGPDHYEYNDDWENASPIEPGRHRDPSLHNSADIDFYQIDLLQNNSLRASVFDEEGLYFVENMRIEIWGWLDDEDEPQRLAETRQGDGEVYALWPNRSTIWHARGKYFIKVYSENGETGHYGLYIQTRGEELSGDEPVDLEQTGLDLYFELHASGDSSAPAKFVREDEESISSPYMLEPIPGTGTEASSTTLSTELYDLITVSGMIHTGGRFYSGDRLRSLLSLGEADRDYFTVFLPSNSYLEIAVTPLFPDAGQPYAAIEYIGQHSYGVPPRYLIEDIRESWPDGAQILRVHAAQQEVGFSVRAEFNENFRNDTGMYELQVLIKRFSDLAFGTIYTPYGGIQGRIEDHYAIPFDEMMQMPILPLEFVFELIDTPYRPEDPFLLNAMSISTGEVMFSFAMERPDWASSQFEFEAALDEANTILRQNFQTLSNLPPNTPHIGLSHNTLQFDVLDRESSSFEQQLIIGNPAEGILNYTIEVKEPWIVIEPKSGSLSENQIARIIVSIDPQGLEPGKYKATVNIIAEGASNSPLPITVSLAIASEDVTKYGIIGEREDGTYPLMHDSDLDGCDDKVEIEGGTWPLDPESVCSYPLNNGGEVTLYNYNNYYTNLVDGRNSAISETFYGADPNLSDNIIITDDIRQGGYIASLKLGPESIVTLYREANYSGIAESFIDSIPMLSYNLIGDITAIPNVLSLKVTNIKQEKLEFGLCNKFDAGFEAWDGLAVGDLDGNGRPEIVHADHSQNNIHFYFYSVGSRSYLHDVHCQFAQGDCLAVGNVYQEIGTPIVDEFIIADHDDNFYIYNNVNIYNNVSSQRGEFFKEFDRFGFKRGDLMAVGDLDGRGTEEIIVGNRDEDKIHVYNYRGEELRKMGIPIDLEAGDAMAVGDIFPDVIGDEIIIGDKSANAIVILSELLGTPMIEEEEGLEETPPRREFGRTFDAYDGLAVGDVNGDGDVEIIHADKDEDKIKISSNDGTILAEINHTFEEGDSLVVGDVNGDRMAEIVIGNDADDHIYIYQRHAPEIEAPPREEDQDNTYRIVYGMSPFFDDYYMQAYGLDLPQFAPGYGYQSYGLPQYGAGYGMPSYYSMPEYGTGYWIQPYDLQPYGLQGVYGMNPYAMPTGYYGLQSYYIYGMQQQYGSIYPYYSSGSSSDSVQLLPISGQTYTIYGQQEGDYYGQTYSQGLILLFSRDN